MIAFALIARTEPEVWKAVAFGVIPLALALALALGLFLDATLVRRDLLA
jgi:predicted phosphoribosyltransferase